jgi:arylformamidase
LDDRSGCVDVTYDLTRLVREDMAVHPGDPAPRITRERSPDVGSGALRTSSLQMSGHVGTHVDAPAHFLAEGRPLTDYPVDAFFGPGIVLDLGEHATISAAALAALVIPESCHVLLKTCRRAGATSPLTPDGAERLLAMRPRSIGIDGYSVDEATSVDFPVHRRLAAAGLLVYVALDLAAVPAGEVTFFGLPLRLDVPDGAPVRAIAIGRKMRLDHD